MKLKELLDKVFENGSLPSIFGETEYTISSPLLKIIEENLVLCDEFLNVNSLSILDEPMDGGKQCVTAKLPDDYVFSGDVKIYSIGLTPPIYNPDEYMKPVKNGCVITPLICDMETFIPKRKLIMDLSVSNNKSLNQIREDLHSLIDDIINNTKDYHSKETRGILIRGIW
jgi:hypothetical protein